MKKSKFIGISLISLIWIISLIIVIPLSVLFFFMIEIEYSKSNIKTDVVKVVDKIHHVQLGTIEGVPYNEMTIYSVELSNGITKTVSFPGMHNYRPGTDIEIYYIKYDRIDIIEVIDFNADTDSDLTDLDSAYEYPFWEDVKSIEVEKVN